MSVFTRTLLYIILLLTSGSELCIAKENIRVLSSLFLKKQQKIPGSFLLGFVCIGLGLNTAELFSFLQNALSASRCAVRISYGYHLTPTKIFVETIVDYNATKLWQHLVRFVVNTPITDDRYAVSCGKVKKNPMVAAVKIFVIFLIHFASGNFALTRDGLDSRGAARHRVSPNYPQFQQISPQAVVE